MIASEFFERLGAGEGRKMVNSDKSVDQPIPDGRRRTAPSRVHAWLSPGQDWIVEIGGVEIVVRLVERRGRRARVAVEVVDTAGNGVQVSNTSFGKPGF
jgi:hypothetical protein